MCPALLTPSSTRCGSPAGPPRSLVGLLVLVQGQSELHATVQASMQFVGVGGNGLVFAMAYRHDTVFGHTMGQEPIGDALCSALGQLHVEVCLALVVRVGLDDEVQCTVFVHQPEHLVQLLLEYRLEGVRSGGEQHVADTQHTVVQLLGVQVGQLAHVEHLLHLHGHHHGVHVLELLHLGEHFVQLAQVLRLANTVGICCRNRVVPLDHRIVLAISAKRGSFRSNRSRLRRSSTLKRTSSPSLTASWNSSLANVL